MATKEKALKKSKLRHAEYYDFQEIQDKLYAESKSGKIFNKLVEVIIRPENIRLAYRNMKKNDGSHTPGTDGKTIADLEKISDEEIVTLVQRKLTWYVPQSVRRVEIRKDNGKIRPLGIPTILDRLIQQCVLQVLEPICEAKFHDHSYGFRPNRSQQNAIAQVHKNMQLSHLHYVVDIDIKGFFDNVNHGKRCGFSKRYFLVLVACRHLTCTKTECRKMFLSLIAPLTTIRLNRGKRSNRLPYIFAQGQER